LNITWDLLGAWGQDPVDGFALNFTVTIMGVFRTTSKRFMVISRMVWEHIRYKQTYIHWLNIGYKFKLILGTVGLIVYYSLVTSNF
jgi:hypothetical protein